MSSLKRHIETQHETFSSKKSSPGVGGHVTVTQRRGKNKFGDTTTLTKKFVFSKKLPKNMFGF